MILIMRFVESNSFFFPAGVARNAECCSVEADGRSGDDVVEVVEEEVAGLSAKSLPIGQIYPSRALVA
jgi:hypothetical protein